MLIILLVALAGMVNTTSSASASAPVLLSGSQWFSGRGVNVCAPSTDPYCGSEYHVGGWNQNWWQCVELAQRLYQKQGWHSGIFAGVSYAYQIYDQAGNLGMSRQANGSITSIVPGDMIVHGSDAPGTGGAGHVSIVDSVSGSTVNVVEQNTYNNQPRATYSFSGGTLSRGGVGTIRGIVHDPANQYAGGGSWNGVGNATFRGSDTLTTGQQLHANEYIMSNDGIFVLIMQSDGNLVIYGPGRRAYWASDTGGHPGAFLGVQSDGNIVIYDGGRALWATNTNVAQRFAMQEDGNLVAYTATGGPVWASNTGQPGAVPIFKGGDALATGQTLSSTQYIRSSNRRYFAMMQGDGNLVLYEPGYMPYWASNTGGHPGAFLAMQSDGNIVIYDGGTPLWGTNTSSAQYLPMQTDGNLVAYDSSGAPVWASNTGGRTQLISLSAPSNGSTVRGSVTLAASPSRNLQVMKVDFKVDGKVVGTSGASPYSYNWNTNPATDGTHSLTATAYDAAGNNEGSSPVTVTVSNPPVTSAPVHSFTANTQLGTSTMPVNIAWSGSDTGSGIATYQVQQRKYGSTAWGAWGTVTSGTTARTLALQLAAGRYQFQVRAVDKADNWSAWKPGADFTVAAYQENSTATVGKVSYAGIWTRDALSGAYGGYTTSASASGRSATFTFTGGRQVAWVAPRANNRGYAHVYLDGVKVATVNLYAASAQARQVVFARTGLNPTATHTLKVYVPGTKPSASSGTRVDVDAFVVVR